MTGSNRMQFSESRTIYVGAAVVIAMAMVFAVSSRGKDQSGAAMGSYRVNATFGRVDGLTEGGEVRLGGVRIGSVFKQTLDQNFRAVVGLMIDNDVKLPTDSSAAIHTDGLFGSKYVILEPGGDEVYLTDGGEITFTQDALIVSELLELIIGEGKRQAREATEAKAQVSAAKAQMKEAAKILGIQPGTENDATQGDN